MNEFDSGERLTQARDLFEEVSSLPANERSAFLETKCGGDRALLREVTTLLHEAESIDSPMEDLAKVMIWPALESLSRAPSRLQDFLDDSPEADSDQVDPLVGKTVSHFEILAPIGRGGMGMVYRARDLTLDRTVALKFLPPSLGSDRQAKERFTHEAKAASGLDHSNIATVYEIAETGDHQLFIAMGYYPGETLKERITHGPIPVEETLAIARQIADGLDMAHTHGVVHRDIKPGNVILSESGTAVLLDFGLAKLSFESGYTQMGQLVGTIAYMSPEQARGDPIDHRTDIWSFGVVLYEMLTGSLPFGGESAQSAIHKILNEDPAPPSASTPDCPDALESILARCLAKSANDRYQNTADLCEDLKRASMGLMPAQKPQKPAWRRRSFSKRLVAGIIGSVLLLFLAFMLLGRSSTDKGNGHQGFSRVTTGPFAEATGFFIGATWGDYNNDGLIDLLVNEDTDERKNLRLYRNEGNGDFVPAPEGLATVEAPGVFATYWADQDNDGDLDIYLTTDIRESNVFLRNDGQGHLIQDQTSAWEQPKERAQAAAWGDYDNDGWVDLFVSTADDERPTRNHLFRNRGDGTMEPVESDVTGIPGISHGCLWSDYNNDGLVDLFVAGQSPVYYRNAGDGEFVGIHAEPNGIPEYTRDVDVGFATADYDNDGDLDVAYNIWGEGPGVLLYRNELKHIFNDVTYLLPSEGTVRGVGAAWADYDNDGHLDIFIGNESGKNRLYHNDGHGSFTLVMETPISELGLRTLGMAWGDYDNDGYLDLVVGNGWREKFPQSFELFHNNGGPNHWIILRLEGTTSNRSAIGAKAWVKARIDEHEITQMREVQSGGNGKSDAGGLRLHFGLGDATEIETLRIEWPSGIVQDLHGVAADQIFAITENAADPEASSAGG